MKNVYYSLIYSHIICTIEAWGSACKTELDKSLILQKRAMRHTYPTTVFGSLISSDPIFIVLETLKVSDIYEYQVSKLIFKCINNIAAVNFHNWLRINHERHGCSTKSNVNVNDGIKIYLYLQ